MSNTTYKLTLDEDGVLVFPDELVDQVGWKEGDELFFRELTDGSFSISTIPFSQEDLLENHGKNHFGQHQADAEALDPELHPVAGATDDRG
jgi:bifunctional DNA-binding transcriptional regulator/antitoxin component of YhaV-PrlF toxin-antitoxin module